jgi:hypothetical protein
MSVNKKRPRTCKVKGCTRGVCSAHIDLCYDHWQQAWDIRAAELAEHAAANDNDKAARE